MLNNLVKQVEREKAGLVDPTEEQRKRLLAEHINQFENWLRNKGVTEKHADETATKVQKMADAKKWRFIVDISASGARFSAGSAATVLVFRLTTII